MVARLQRSLAVLALVAGIAATVHAQNEWKSLTLAAFNETWDTINQSFYDPTFGGLDWPGVAAELRPQVQNAATPEAARRVIQQMLARLHQSHFSLLTSAIASDALPGEAVVPVELRVMTDGVVIFRVRAGSTAERAGLKPGDRLVRVDNEEAQSWRASSVGSDERAKKLDEWRRAFRALHGQPGTVAVVDVLDPQGHERVASVARTVEPGDAVTLGNLPPMHVRTTVTDARTPSGKTVGVIAFNIWMTAVSDPFAAAIDKYRHSKGIVIDLRGNPGGLADMIRGIAGHLVSEPAVLGRMHMRAADLEFRANPRRSTAEGGGSSRSPGRWRCIVDDLTASASECFAGGLQSLGRARVFGRRAWDRRCRRHEAALEWRRPDVCGRRFRDLDRAAA